jgi:hypothetical protein
MFCTIAAVKTGRARAFASIAARSLGLRESAGPGPRPENAAPLKKRGWGSRAIPCCFLAACRLRDSQAGLGIAGAKATAVVTRYERRL